MMLSVKVIPNAATTEIVGYVGDVIKIRVQAPAEKGKANAELVSFLAERLGVPKTAVEIVRGAGSSRKLIRISGVDATALPLV
ncbi:MAG: YggU family protein [Candidatus Kerfeldbacteria bacterium]|nr:YggU family protein [Candidatus Kerfeldbacteria bacterium]